ncbi:M20 metallopeptidase family protein [Peribacillus muralis]|uniref:M20 metallopeptidase family protein n=1 Tax=Peribacillus muralis TaxID=264697 RepID=UPI003D086EE0
MFEMLAKQAVADRRHIHENPELSGSEWETTKFIRERLESLNIEILDFDPPGVIGYIRGTKGGKTIALRADIDALPILEEGDKPYISKVKGVSHACGHDGHTAILLAAAEWFKKPGNEVEPNILFIFQSAEEITPSGADRLIKMGVLEGVDTIFGIHLWQSMEKGKMGLKAGAAMASVDDFEVRIQGSGGHGATPHETVDPIYIATHLIQAYQGIISRKLNPVHSGVLTVGKIEGGSTYNVIPDTAKLIGTIRALSVESVQTIQQQMVKITEGLCQTFGAKGHIDFIVGTPPLVNDPIEASFAETVIRKTFGEDRFQTVDAYMGAEDFSYYLQKKPGAFIFVGMNSEKSAFPHHHPKFDIDEDVFAEAIELFTAIVTEYR